MRKEGPNGPDQHKKEVVRRQWDKGALGPFDASIGLVQRIEVDAESSATQRKRSERPKVRRFAERPFARERQRPQAVVGEVELPGPRGRRQADRFERQRGRRRGCPHGWQGDLLSRG